MNASEKVRRLLWDGGYTIYFEDLCSEKGKVYNVICARYEGKPGSYGEHELHSSAYLVENRHPLLKDFISKKLRRLKAMYRGGGESDNGLAEIIENLEGLIT
jgi:tRNA (adenine22-N1)-methyltransferase